MIKFTVFGEPQTAGSKRAFVPTDKNKQPFRRPNGGVVVSVVDDNPKSRSWKNQVATEAAKAYKGELLRGPLFVRLTFYRPRPKGHFGTGRNSAILKDSADPAPTTKPDVLKLARAVEDAITGVVWHDDAQIVEECLSKQWGEPARCEVVITKFIPRG